MIRSRSIPSVESTQSALDRRHTKMHRPPPTPFNIAASCLVLLFFSTVALAAPPSVPLNVAPRDFPSGTFPQGVAVGDFNVDGKRDVVTSTAPCP